MKELTKAEEQVMHILWKLEQAFVKEIVAEMPEPKPAYNTVSTIVRILENKGFVEHEAFGKTHRYYPLISKERYTQFFLKRVVNDYFENSFQEMVSFFSQDKSISVTDLEEIMDMIQKQIREKRQSNG